MASRIRTARDTPLGDRPSVASELEAIFAPLPQIAPPAGPAASPRRPRSRGTGLRLWLALLGAVALAALVGSLAFLTPRARQTPSSAAIATAPLLPARQAVAAPPQPAQQPRPVAHAPSKTRPAHPPEHKSEPKPKRAAAPPVHHGRCPRFATEAWCLHGTITAADDRLRDAYQAAVRAGVDRDTLVDVRSDWKRLRGRANRDPQALIRGYALLTQELRAEALRARR